jgi:DNA-directed RNA polymerase alpha subunit
MLGSEEEANRARMLRTAEGRADGMSATDPYLRHLRAYLQAECDAFLEMIEHRESGSTEPHDLNEIGIGVSTASALQKGGIFNVRILCEQTRAHIESLRNIGSRRADEIELALLMHGYLLQLPAGEEDS